MSEKELEIYRQLRISQDKYTYYILTAAGAGIGLAINQTQDMILSWSLLPLGVALLLWGLSFFFGCRHLKYVSSFLYTNADIIKVEEGRLPQVVEHPEYQSAAIAGIKEALENNSIKANKFSNLQFKFLVFGAVSYILTMAYFKDYY
ncbi:MAG: hypothetical protein ACOCRK_11935 [bacterium]